LPVDSLQRNISFWDFKAFFDIYRLCRKYRFDIVHTHSSKTGFLGRMAARLAGVKKIVHTSHGLPFNDFQSFPVRWFYRFCDAFAGLFCDHVVFVNNYDRQMMLRKKLIASGKATTIYNAVELAEIGKKKKKQDRFIIGSSFRFWTQKNPLQTVEAAIQTCRLNSQIDFIFLGDGELLEACTNLVDAAAMNDRITFPGWQQNIYFWLEKFDVFLLYSKWEGLPVSILEAMSAGLPIVASQISGNVELVSARNGITVKLNEVDKLIGVLINLPSKKDDLARWGAESRRFVEENCALPDFITKYCRIYEQ